MNHQSCIKILGSEDASLQKIIERNSLNRQILIATANQVFGYKKWSHLITNQTLDSVKIVNAKYVIGCSTILKVQLADGTCHEEFEYGAAESEDESIAIYIAKLESSTNALKQALISFGIEVEAQIERIENDINLNNKEQTASVTRAGITGTRETTLETLPVSDCTAAAIKAPSKDKTSAAIANQADKVPVSPSGAEEKSVKELHFEFSKIIPSSTPKVVGNTESIQSTSKGQMTEEEIRQERKRRQREKQDQYRQCYQEKQRKEESPKPSRVKF